MLFWEQTLKGKMSFASFATKKICSQLKSSCKQYFPSANDIFSSSKTMIMSLKMKQL